MPPIGPRGRTLGPLLPARWHAPGTTLYRLGVMGRWAILFVVPLATIAIVLWLA